MTSRQIHLPLQKCSGKDGADYSNFKLNGLLISLHHIINKHFLRIWWVQTPIWNTICRQESALEFRTSHYKNLHLRVDCKIGALGKDKEEKSTHMYILSPFRESHIEEIAKASGMTLMSSLFLTSIRVVAALKKKKKKIFIPPSFYTEYKPFLKTVK